MRNPNTKPHPYLISNWKIKTQAKIGDMLMDIVRNNNKDEQIEICGITKFGKKYHIGDKTFSKYLKRSIYAGEDQRNNKKTFILSKIDIILIREIMYLENRYSKLDIPQKYIIRFLIAKLGKML